MKQLEHRIPPPLVLLLTLLLMFVLAKFDDSRSLRLDPALLNTVLATCFMVLGCFIAILGVKQFSAAQTTVNPLQPERATKLVDTGVFKITRNPMYLGMALVVCGAACYFASVLVWVGLPIFVAFITRFQIIPEERALLSLFGAEFEAYKTKTRRWL